MKTRFFSLLVATDFDPPLLGDRLAWFQAIVKKKGIKHQTLEAFKRIIWDNYIFRGRKFPFRFGKSEVPDPYKIVVSEIMLQQTQAPRVVDKYLEFIKELPDFETLKNVPVDKLLSLWLGLGYNRRALALKEIARIVIDELGGRVPTSPDELIKLPHVGPATSCSIATFAFQEPVVFVETNIRRVFIQFFFKERRNITDAEILPLVDATLDKENPREWYYALMDYGVFLKKTYKGLENKSAHYKKQPSFKDSNRQLRGKILRLAVEKKASKIDEFALLLGIPAERVASIVQGLVFEGFLKEKEDGIFLP